jgi:hypothetical protein
MAATIPTHVHLAFLERTIEIHWDRHALLMVIAWFVLVPTALIAARFFKPEPQPYGIARDTSRFDRRLLWWTIHWTVLYTAIGLSLAGAALAFVVSQGFSGTPHAVLGLATVVMGALQVVSAWLRGSHGGRNGAHSDPMDSSTWHGDHYDMTPRRRWFEAYHKTSGYVTLSMALAATATGLAQHWVGSAASVAGGAVLLGVLAAIVLEAAGLRQDTYRSVYGNHPEHPFNKARSGR